MQCKGQAADFKADLGRDFKWDFGTGQMEKLSRSKTRVSVRRVTQGAVKGMLYCKEKRETV